MGRDEKFGGIMNGVGGWRRVCGDVVFVFGL